MQKKEISIFHPDSPSQVPSYSRTFQWVDLKEKIYIQTWNRLFSSNSVSCSSPWQVACQVSHLFSSSLEMPLFTKSPTPGTTPSWTFVPLLAAWIPVAERKFGLLQRASILKPQIWTPDPYLVQAIWLCSTWLPPLKMKIKWVTWMASQPPCEDPMEEE